MICQFSAEENNMFSKIKGWFGKNEQEINLLRGDIPRHIAIIMDGNGRWGKKRGLPRVAGHRAGMRAVKDTTIAANQIGVKILTLYAFSTENWKRPKDEVDFLMRLVIEFIQLELDELIENNVQVRMMGNLGELPSYTIDAINKAIEATRMNTGLILNIALNYGSRKEMIDALREIATKASHGEVDPYQIDEEFFSSHLLSKEIGDPDLLIRTSGEVRISNFMLWQLAYTEMWFCDIYWPDFTKEHLYEAIRDFQKRIRRYGALK